MVKSLVIRLVAWTLVDAVEHVQVAGLVVVVHQVGEFG